MTSDKKIEEKLKEITQAIINATPNGFIEPRFIDFTIDPKFIVRFSYVKKDQE